MSAHGTRVLHLAGIRQAVFTTDETRREAAAFALRCRAKKLRQTLRLRRPSAATKA